MGITVVRENQQGFAIRENQRSWQSKTENRAVKTEKAVENRQGHKFRSGRKQTPLGALF